MSKTRDISPKMKLPSSGDEFLIPLGTEVMGQKLGGLSFFSDVFKRGYGTDVFGTDIKGSWWGGADFATATASIDYAGNAVLNSVTITGYIPDGEAAADVNANATKVSGTKIVDVSITSTQIADNAISTPKLLANSVTSDKIIANAVTSDKIIANAVTASKISVSNLSAISADVGTITAGSITGVTVASSSGNNKILLDSGDYVRFYVGGVLRASIRGVTATRATGIVNDGDYVANNNKSYLIASSTGGASEYGGIGITSVNQFWLTLGTDNTFFIKNNAQNLNIFTISVNSAQLYSEYAIVGKAGIYFGTSTSSAHNIFESSGSVNLNTSGSFKFNKDNINLNGKVLSVRDTSVTTYKDGSGRGAIGWDGAGDLKVDATGPWFQINGNAKSAIVPTSKGYNALYCAEAPEVWFFDFCDSKDSIDPLFLEVTEGEMKWIKTEDGYQVWRRRSGHAHKRFTPKTEEQFLKNERFLSLAKK